MGTSAEAVAGSVHARLRSLEEAVAAVCALEVGELDGAGAAEVFTRVHGLAERLRAVAIGALPAIESDGLWALDGHRSAAQWVVHHTGASFGAARRDLRLARALREELPVTAAAVRSGEVGLEHARVLATVAATSDARRHALVDPGSPCAEAFLVGHARHLPVDPFRSLVRRWAAAADPQSDERGYRDAVEREFLDVSATFGGYHLAGFLTPENGTVLATALAAVSTPPAPGDDRPGPRRRAGDLVSLARTVLDHGLARTGAAVRPHLNIHLDVEHLAPAWAAELRDTAHALHGSGRAREMGGRAGAGIASGRGSAGGPGVDGGKGVEGSEGVACGLGTLVPGPATLDDGTPVPLSVLRRLACDSEVTRILLGPGSAILDVGRAARTVTGQLRRAVIARDRHCAYPGCHAPPPRCEVHHPHHWADGGPTSLTNSVLLCWHHHDLVHRTGTTVSATAGTGMGSGPRAVGSVRTVGAAVAALRATSPAVSLHPAWTFHDRHGHPIGPPPPADPRPPPLQHAPP